MQPADFRRRASEIPMNVLVLEPPRLGLYSPSISQADIFFNAYKRRLCIGSSQLFSSYNSGDRTDSVSPVGSWLCRFSAPGLVSCGVFFQVSGLARRYQSRMPCGSPRGMRMSRYGYRHPCALVAARHLLNTTWSLKLPYKAAWEYRDENILFVRCDWRGFGRDRSRTGTDRRSAGTDGS
jgi:hypothetical protein